MNQDKLEHYTKEARIIDLGKANSFALLSFIPVILLYVLPFYLIWNDQNHIEQIKDYFRQGIFYPITMIFVVMTGGIVLHELIHGITWSLYAKSGFKSIKFGILMKMLTPYCHCKEALTKQQYIIGALMPFIVLGLLPGIAALVTGNAGLLAFSIFFTVAAVGDFMIVQLMLKEDNDSLIIDHPSEAGYYVYLKKELPTEGN